MYLQGMKVTNKCPDLKIRQEKKKKSAKVTKHQRAYSSEAKSHGPRIYPVLAHTVLPLHVVARRHHHLFCNLVKV